jgi:hypothetical protein
MRIVGMVPKKRDLGYSLDGSINFITGFGSINRRKDAPLVVVIYDRCGVLVESLESLFESLWIVVTS